MKINKIYNKKWKKCQNFQKLSLRVFKAETVFSLVVKFPKTETSLRNLPFIFQAFRPLTAATLKNPKRTPMPGKVGTSFERNSQER